MSIKDNSMKKQQEIFEQELINLWKKTSINVSGE